MVTSSTLLADLRTARRRGFTLIELLVVVAIIGILAVIAMSNLQQAIKRAREGKTFAHLRTMRTAAMTYRALNDTWPASITDAGPPGPGGNWSEQPAAAMVQFIGPALPQAMVDGGRPFEDGYSDYSGGVWQAVGQTDYPDKNNRGWHYNVFADSREDTRLRINNNSISTEGSVYYQY